MDVPDEPAACCWDCRMMIAAGLDPAALVGMDDTLYDQPRRSDS